MRLWTVLNELIGRTKPATSTELATGSGASPRTIAPDVFYSSVIGIPNLSLDVTAASGTIDGDLYAAIVALGWEDDVID